MSLIESYSINILKSSYPHLLSAVLFFFIKDETLNFATIGTHMNAVALVLKYCAWHLEKEDGNQGVNLSF
jgi:hypothetical protein